MALIFTEDFEGAASGVTMTTGNTVFSQVSPANPPTFSNAQAISGTRSMLIPSVTTNSSIQEHTITATNTGWYMFYIYLTAGATSSTAIHNCWIGGGTTKVGDIRLIAGGTTIQIRDNNTNRYTSGASLPLNQWVRIAVKWDTTAGQCQVKAYWGANLHGSTPDINSGTQTLTATGAYNNPRIGPATTDATLAGWIDFIRFDNANEPDPVSSTTNVNASDGGSIAISDSGTVASSPTANAGSDQTNVESFSTFSLTGSGTPGSGSITGYAWSQISGTTASIVSPTSQNTDVVAPGLSADETLVFRLTVTQTGGATGTDDVNIGVIKALEYNLNGTGSWIPTKTTGLAS